MATSFLKIREAAYDKAYKRIKLEQAQLTLFWCPYRFGNTTPHIIYEYE